MNSNTTVKQAHPRIPREFWEALLTVHNYLFMRVLHDDRIASRGVRSERIACAFQTMDCWLDIAIEEGWLD